MIHAARSADDADAQEVLLAAVLARSSRLAPVTEIVQTLRDRLPELGAIEIPDPKEPTEGEQAVYMFEVEGNRAIVAGMPRGYPWSDLEGPCQTAWWWPDAEEALRLGYVLDVVESEQLAEASLQLAERVAAGSPHSHRLIKQLTYEGLTASVGEHMVRHTAAMAASFKSDDHREGVAAFLERRPARFTGK